MCIAAMVLQGALSGQDSRWQSGPSLRQWADEPAREGATVSAVLQTHQLNSPRRAQSAVANPIRRPCDFCPPDVSAVVGLLARSCTHLIRLGWGLDRVKPT